MSLDKIDKIKKIGRSLEELQGPQRITAPNTQAPSREQFDAIMRKDATHVDTGKQVTDATKPSLMDEVRNSSQPLNKRASHQEILVQLDDTLSRIDKVKEKLNTPDLQLKNSMQGVMRKKLLHIDESLKSALAKVDRSEGVEMNIGDKSIDKATSPIERFLGLLSQGQSRLYSLSQGIQQIAESKTLSPAALLTIQVKMNVVQQQMELFTSLLNKALESTKTLMNVQV